MLSPTAKNTIRILRNKVKRIKLDEQYKRAAYIRAYETLTHIRLRAHGKEGDEAIVLVLDLINKWREIDDDLFDKWRKDTRELKLEKRAKKQGVQ